MKSVFEPFFEQYSLIAKQIDILVDKVKQEFSSLVTCKLECSDCCHALFDLTFIEALYLNERFNKTVTNKTKKNTILENSSKIDRRIYKLKKESQKSLKDGEKTSEQILYEMATFKIRCPLLTYDNLCEMYEVRPITCRIYGIPTSFAGQGHTCGLSGFKTGELYPTINLDSINKKLHAISNDLVKTLESKHTEMGKILMPLSMSLITEFSHEYLGLKIEKEKV